MVELLKSLVPLKFLYWLKYFFSYSFHDLGLNKCGKTIYYLDAPDYGNLGDQAIAYAIQEFAKKQFPDYSFCEVLQKDYPKYRRWLRRNISNNDIIFLTGGGNMGNLYRIYEASRRVVIEDFPNNKIVVFPQSICYKTNIFGRISFNWSKQYYGRKNVTICCRESNSLKQMRELDSSVLFVPDIVLSLHLSADFVCENTRCGIGICLRNDVERLLTDEDLQLIKQVLKNKYSNDITLLSTMAEVRYIDYFNRKDLLFSKFREFSSKELVVTDRLHAMIFAVLTNTPCVVFDNNNNKISGTYEWIKGYSNVKLIHSVKDLSTAIDEVVKSHEKWCPEGKYSKLIEKIKG